MADTTQQTYVWVMEWTDLSAASPRPTFDVHTLEPQAGVRAEDFEKFMLEELFPVVDLQPTTATERRFAVRHALYKQIGAFDAPGAGVFPEQVQDPSVLTRFRSLGTTTITQYFDLVGSVEMRASPPRA